MERFFAGEQDLPAGAGWQLFGPEHLSALAVVLAVSVLLCVCYRRLPAKRRRRWRKTIACGNVGLELLRDVILAINGSFGIDYLPLHLCSMALFICLWDAFRPGDATHQILYGLCLPGAVGALLFPNWTAYPPTNFRFWVGFAGHILVVTYVVMQLSAGDFRPAPRSAWKCAAFLLAVAPPVYLFDRVFDLNYLFINWPSPGSPLEWFAAWLGNPGYLLPYAVLIFGICALMYLPYWRADRAKKTARRS